MTAQQEGRVHRLARWALPAAVLATGLGAPAAVAKSLPSTLTGTTTVVSTGSAYTTVRLARTLRFPGINGWVDLPARLDVSDPTHFVGITLVKPDMEVVDYAKTRPSVMVMSLPNGSGGYRYELRLPLTSDSIPAGTYWLYVLATRPERVTWHLPLSGAARVLRATTPATMHTTLSTSPGPLPGTSVVPISSVYGHATVSAHAELWAFVWTHGTDMKAQEIDVCQYNGSDPYAVAAASLHPLVCPDSVDSSGGGVGADLVNTPSDLVTWTSGPLDGLWPDFGFKESDETAGDVQWTAGRVIWLDLPA